MASRQQRLRRQSRIQSAKECANQIPEDSAANYMGHLTECPPEGIGLYIRGSRERMRRLGRLESQREQAIQRAASLGATLENGLIRKVFQGIESGKPNADRLLLDEANTYCLKHNLILVVAERSRILRPSNWNGKWECEPPTQADWELFKSRWQCRIASFSPPTITAVDARKLQIRRGQQKRKGGRPKGTKNPLYAKVKKLQSKGKTLSQIIALLPVPKTTVHRWMRLA